MLIGELSIKTGVPASTIRYYEKRGLLPYIRNTSGYREYPQEVTNLLSLIVKAKELGFTLKEIKEFSTLVQELGQERGRVRAKLERKLEEIDIRIKELKSFKKNINKILKASCPL